MTLVDDAGFEVTLATRTAAVKVGATRTLTLLVKLPVASPLGYAKTIFSVNYHWLSVEKEGMV